MEENFVDTKGVSRSRTYKNRQWSTSDQQTNNILNLSIPTEGYSRNAAGASNSMLSTIIGLMPLVD